MVDIDIKYDETDDKPYYRKRGADAWNPFNLGPEKWVVSVTMTLYNTSSPYCQLDVKFNDGTSAMLYAGGFYYGARTFNVPQ